MKIVLRGDSVVSDMNIVVPPPVNYAGGPFWDPYSFGIRSIQTVDLNADGYRDIFISPSYARYNAVGSIPSSCSITAAVVLLMGQTSSFRQ